MIGEIKRERGFLTIAQNSGELDYVKMAYALALSIKATQKENPYLSIMITPETKVPAEMIWAFDEIIEIPWGDHAQYSKWKLENEWKAYHASPYRETIKLDADMLFPADISSWWDLLADKDFWATTQVINYRGNIITSDIFRKTFTFNYLPNIYTAFMYFKKSTLAHKIFDFSETIFYNWEKFFYEFLVADERPKFLSTDVIFALAIKLLDLADECTGKMAIPTFAHMKTDLQGWVGEMLPEDWTKIAGLYVTPELDFKIGAFRQKYPVHYHIKTIVDDKLISYYERYLEHEQKRLCNI
jgi:hypothetical protein